VQFLKIFKSKTKLTKAVDIWIDYIAGQNSHKEITIHNYRKCSKVMKENYIPNNIYIETLSFDQLEIIKNNIHKKNSAASMNANHIPILNRTLKLFYNKNIIKKDFKIDRVKDFTHNEVDFLTQDQFFEFINKIGCEKDKIRFSRVYWASCFLAYSGIRPRELKKLKWSHLMKKPNEKKRKMRIITSAHNKLGRTITVPKTLEKLLLKMPHFSSEYVSPYYDQKEYQFRRDLLEIKNKYGFKFKLNPSIFRKSFATWLACSTDISVQHLQAYLGHVNISSTMRYVNLREVLEKSDVIRGISLNGLRKIA
jgi:integrase